MYIKYYFLKGIDFLAFVEKGNRDYKDFNQLISFHTYNIPPK